MKKTREPRNPLFWSIAAAVIILVLAVAIRIHREAERNQASPVEPAATTGLTPSVTPSCAAVRTTDSTGAPLNDAVLGPVVAVHEAACRRDYDELLAMMETPFGTRAPSEVLDHLRADDGAALALLAQTLETAPVRDQGGLTYYHPYGAVAIFARGTHDQPGRWSCFTLTGDGPAIADCF